MHNLRIQDLFELNVNTARLVTDGEFHPAPPVYFNCQHPQMGIPLQGCQDRVVATSQYSEEISRVKTGSRLKWADAHGSYHIFKESVRHRTREAIADLIYKEVQNHLLCTGAAKELLGELVLVGLMQTTPLEWQVIFTPRPCVFMPYTGY